MANSQSDTRIKKLSPLLINQLAAGEVVTRPAAVVKELLENAIDADATDIEVHITQGGMGSIEVVDNGVGIHPDDMVMAITRHATSKVADVANLHGIMTLGFRGEALAATAAVSRLTLTSSHDHSGIGRQLQVAGVVNDEPKLLPVVRSRGTTITIKDLYFNVPARRGNLKSIATEFGHIETIVREVVLARADITISLFHDKKKRLSFSASATDGNRLPLSRLEQAMATSLTDTAIEVAVDLSSLIQQSTIYNNGKNAGSHASISGWLWPMYEQKDSLPKLLYVNGRLVKEALISNQLRQLAQNSQLAGAGYALYFDLPTEWLNINVHPSKQRIKISPLNNIMAHLSHALRSKLTALEAKNSIESGKKLPSIDSLNNVPSRNNPSANQPFDESWRKKASIDYITQDEGGQVQSPRQPYQSSENKLSFVDTKSYINNSLDQITNVDRPESADNAVVMSNVLIETKGLPYCLELITSLNGVAPEPSLSAYDYDYDKTLPWLLFHNQGGYLLIAVDDWQSQIGLLFASSIFEQGSFRKDKMPAYANDINRQLATISAQMTKQDLSVFIKDVESLLSKNAIKSIDRQQLVALILSSTFEWPLH